MKFKIEADKGEVKKILDIKRDSIYSHLNDKQKEMIKYLSIIILFVLFISGIVYALIYLIYNTNSNYITKEQCKTITQNEIIKIENLSKWDILFNCLVPFIPGFAFAIIVGWILHGVGFKII